jgi:hypothetical protein
MVYHQRHTGQPLSPSINAASDPLLALSEIKVGSTREGYEFAIIGGYGYLTFKGKGGIFFYRQ